MAKAIVRQRQSVVQIRQRVDELRKEHQLSYRKIAESVGITENALNSIFTRNDAKLSVLVDLAKVFNVDLVTFMKEGGTTDTRLIKLQNDKDRLELELEKVQMQNGLLNHLVVAREEMIEVMKMKV